MSNNGPRRFTFHPHPALFQPVPVPEVTGGVSLTSDSLTSGMGGALGPTALARPVPPPQPTRTTREALSVVTVIAMHRLRAHEGRPGTREQALYSQQWRYVANATTMALRHLLKIMSGDIVVGFSTDVHSDHDPIDACLETLRAIRDPDGALGLTMWSIRDAVSMLTAMRAESRGNGEW